MNRTNNKTSQNKKTDTVITTKNEKAIVTISFKKTEWNNHQHVKRREDTKPNLSENNINYKFNSWSNETMRVISTKRLEA